MRAKQVKVTIANSCCDLMQRAAAMCANASTCAAIEGWISIGQLVNAFEFDMAFEPAELAAELEQFFAKRGWRWSGEHASSTEYAYTVALADGPTLVVVVRPLPAERMTYVGLLPRTLLEVRCTNGADIEALRREFLLAF